MTEDGPKTAAMVECCGALYGHASNPEPHRSEVLVSLGEHRRQKRA